MITVLEILCSVSILPEFYCEYKVPIFQCKHFEIHLYTVLNHPEE